MSEIINIYIFFVFVPPYMHIIVYVCVCLCMFFDSFLKRNVLALHFFLLTLVAF
jgi:hypothetical protein